MRPACMYSVVNIQKQRFLVILNQIYNLQEFMEYNMTNHTTSILKELDTNLQTKDSSQSDKKWINKNDMPKIKAQFKGVQLKILNMFTLAKSELSMSYQRILNRIKKIERYLYSQNSKVMPSFWNLLEDIEQQLELKIEQMNQNIQKISIQSFLFDQLLSLLPDSTNTQHFICSQRKINMSTISSAHRFTQKLLNQTIADIDTITVNQYKSAIKVKPNGKRLQNLCILSGKWDVLEVLSLENKQISNMVPLCTVISQTLQQINLSFNNLTKLQFLKQAEYPVLRTLNLQKNMIGSLQGIQYTKFRNLKILNFSQNKIKKLDGIEQAQFLELIELNLSKNKIERCQKLIDCDFPKLEVLNLDHNHIESLQFILSSTFYRLKILSFCYNSIKSIDYLKKCKLQKLEALLGYNNKLDSIDFLEYCDFPQLKQIILNNNLITDISVIERMNFQHLTQFDLQNNNIRPQQIFCFVTKSDQSKKAKKKYPFIQL